MNIRELVSITADIAALWLGITLMVYLCISWKGEQNENNS